MSITVISEQEARESAILRRVHGRVQCVRCGEILHAGEGCYRIHGFPYCELCLDSADAEELVRICEIPKRVWLEQMGFCYECVQSEECV